MTLPYIDFSDNETYDLPHALQSQLPVRRHPKLSLFEFLGLIDGGLSLQTHQLPADVSAYSLPVGLNPHPWGLLTAQSLRKGHREIAEFIYDQYRVRVVADRCGLAKPSSGISPEQLMGNSFYGAFTVCIEKNVESLFLKMVTQCSFSLEHYAGALCLAAYGGNFNMVRSLIQALPPKSATPAYLRHSVTIAVKQGHVEVLKELKKWCYVYADHFDDLLKMQPTQEVEELLFQMVVPARLQTALSSSAQA